MVYLSAGTPSNSSSLICMMERQHPNRQARRRTFSSVGRSCADAMTRPVCTGQAARGTRRVTLTCILTQRLSSYLDNSQVIAAYLAAALEDGDPDVLLSAVGDVAKALHCGPARRTCSHCAPPVLVQRRARFQPGR
ncbi:MAG: hypothetical protein ABW205_05780 [Burkholderiales bacterium]